MEPGGHVVQGLELLIPYFDPRVMVGESLSRTSGSFESTRDRGILGFFLLQSAGFVVSLWVPVVSFIFVLLSRFPVVKVSSFLEVGRVYSFLVTFWRPLCFSVSQKNVGFLT